MKSIYDADGQRVKGTINGVSTIYIAGVYEWQNGATTLYYEGNALRRSGYASDNGVFYLLQDHLKSSSSFVTQDSVVASHNYYFPFGGNRGGTALSSLTAKRFTGQYHEAGLPGGEGLSYYGARWYDAIALTAGVLALHGLNAIVTVTQDRLTNACLSATVKCIQDDLSCPRRQQRRER